MSALGSEADIWLCVQDMNQPESERFSTVMRQRTAAHLRALAVNREYLVTRYGPELTSTLSQINRLAATLEEVAAKVGTVVRAARSLGSASASQT